MIPLTIPNVTVCTTQQFELVKQYIAELELDDRQLSAEQFLVMSKEDNILGFGRIRKYKGFSELCSLGVMTEQRMKGIGSTIIKAFIENTTEPLYLVCIIPQFFEPLGFSICNTFPPEIQAKLDYCHQSLTVEEPYVVMRRVPTT